MSPAPYLTLYAIIVLASLYVAYWIALNVFNYDVVDAVQTRIKGLWNSSTVQPVPTAAAVVAAAAASAIQKNDDDIAPPDPRMYNEVADTVATAVTSLLDETSTENGS